MAEDVLEEVQSLQTSSKQESAMWKRTSKQKYWDELEVLPPAYQDHHGFLMGEPSDHDICEVLGTMAARYEAYISRAGRHYVSIRPLTMREYQKYTRK